MRLEAVQQMLNCSGKDLDVIIQKHYVLSVYKIQSMDSSPRAAEVFIEQDEVDDGVFRTNLLQLCLYITPRSVIQQQQPERNKDRVDHRADGVDRHLNTPI